MWFSVFDYPKFITSTKNDYWINMFKSAGFKTIRIDNNLNGSRYEHFRYVDNSRNKRFWLDEHEFTFFVLRYS